MTLVRFFGACCFHFCRHRCYCWAASALGAWPTLQAPTGRRALSVTLVLANCEASKAGIPEKGHGVMD
jgi:hypothetical protein